jgi:hypothetical protein
VRTKRPFRITRAMIERASKAYASERHPARWDGEPWGECGRRNHRLAIEAAIKAAFREHKEKQ